MQKNFSRPLKIDDLPQSEQHYHLEATLKDCKMLAEVLKVPEVAAVKADIRLKYTHADHRLDVNGHVFAKVTILTFPFVMIRRRHTTVSGKKPRTGRRNCPTWLSAGKLT